MEQTELCRPISRPAEQEEEGMDVLADDVTAETAGTKSAIIKVNNSSRECRKIKIGFETSLDYITRMHNSENT